MHLSFDRFRVDPLRTSNRQLHLRKSKTVSSCEQTVIITITKSIRILESIDFELWPHCALHIIISLSLTRRMRPTSGYSGWRVDSGYYYCCYHYCSKFKYLLRFTKPKYWVCSLFFCSKSVHGHVFPASVQKMNNRGKCGDVVPKTRNDGCVPKPTLYSSIVQTETQLRHISLSCAEPKPTTIKV